MSGDGPGGPHGKGPFSVCHAEIHLFCFFSGHQRHEKCTTQEACSAWLACDTLHFATLLMFGVAFKNV